MPEDLHELKALSELDVSFNKLAHLPPSLGLSGAFVQVNENPLEDVPPDVVARGSTAIKQHLVTH